MRLPELARGGIADHGSSTSIRASRKALAMKRNLLLASLARRVTVPFTAQDSIIAAVVLLWLAGWPAAEPPEPHTLDLENAGRKIPVSRSRS